MQLLIITDDLELKLLKKSKRFTVLGPLQWKVPIKLKRFWGHSVLSHMSAHPVARSHSSSHTCT